MDFSHLFTLHNQKIHPKPGMWRREKKKHDFGRQGRCVCFFFPPRDIKADLLPVRAQESPLVPDFLGILEETVIENREWG